MIPFTIYANKRPTHNKKSSIRASDHECSMTGFQCNEKINVSRINYGKTKDSFCHKREGKLLIRAKAAIWLMQESINIHFMTHNCDTKLTFLHTRNYLWILSRSLLRCIHSFNSKSERNSLKSVNTFVEKVFLLTDKFFFLSKSFSKVFQPEPSRTI